MPELPEIETLALQLRRDVLGLRVTDVSLHRRDVVGSGGTRRDLLLGARIGEVRRAGKQLALVSDDGRVVCVHLGMTGQLLLVGPGRRPVLRDHVHASWRLARGGVPAGRLLFRDPRRFGGLWAYPDARALHEARWSRLGPDALTIRTRDLHALLARSRSPVKARLLDQRAIAGVGNIYADEALFRAGIHPRTPSRSVGRTDSRRLADALRRTLRCAIDAGGSTLRDYRHADGREGGFQARHAVYARRGLPCIRCGTTLRGGVLAQRATVWCPRCQRTPKA